jgi:hypothetical protein
MTQYIPAGNATTGQQTSGGIGNFFSSVLDYAGQVATIYDRFTGGKRNDQPTLAEQQAAQTNRLWLFGLVGVAVLGLVVWLVARKG